MSIMIKVAFATRQLLFCKQKQNRTSSPTYFRQHQPKSSCAFPWLVFSKRRSQWHKRRLQMSWRTVTVSCNVAERCEKRQALENWTIIAWRSQIPSGSCNFALSITIWTNLWVWRYLRRVVPTAKHRGKLIVAGQPKEGRYQTSQASSPVRKRLLRRFGNRSFYWFLIHIVGRRHLVDKRQSRTTAYSG